MSFYFDFMVDSKDMFSSVLMKKLVFGNSYSLLVRVELPDGSYRMLGTQITFSFDGKNYDKEVNKIYSKIQSRLGEFLQRYEVDYFNSIQILIISVKLSPSLLLKNINKISISGRGANVIDVKNKHNYKFLPLTVNSDYFGRLILNEERLRLVDLINKQKGLLSKASIGNEDFDEMFKYNNYVILSKHINDNVYSRDIYDYDIGSFEGRLCCYCF
jgi:hypothetical protein